MGLLGEGGGPGRTVECYRRRPRSILVEPPTSPSEAPTPPEASTPRGRAAVAVSVPERLESQAHSERGTDPHPLDHHTVGASFE